MNRRDALRWLAAGGIGLAATQSERALAQEDQRILGIETLPKVGPWPTDDPFLFCVHHHDRFPAGNEKLGPNTSLAGRRLGHDFSDRDGWSMYHGDTVPGFPRHPHRGFETITVVQSGMIDHADSLGAVARYGDGDVQWLTAGDGINHAEMFPLLRDKAPNPIDFFQIWLNLPAQRKRVIPAFDMLWEPSIPQVKRLDAKGRLTTVRVIAGRYGDRVPPSPPKASYAAEGRADFALWVIQLSPKAHWRLPAASAEAGRSLYVTTGAGLRVHGEPIAPRSRVRLQPSSHCEIHNGAEPSQLLLLQARPLGEPVVKHGPFVMNSRAEIQQAFEDYRRTGFGGWPWREDGPVHGKKADRFAQWPDGRRETPT